MTSYSFAAFEPARQIAFDFRVAFDAFDPDEKRDVTGRWTKNGGGTAGEKQIEASGHKVTKPRAREGAVSAMVQSLPVYEEHVNPNTTWEFISTPKGVAGLTMHDMYGGDGPRAEIHWLTAVDRGAGRAAMEMLTRAADEHGVTLQLNAVPLDVNEGDKGKKLPKTKLEEFYKGFGFRVERRDRSGDRYATMVRDPDHGLKRQNDGSLKDVDDRYWIKRVGKGRDYAAMTKHPEHGWTEIEPKLHKSEADAIAAVAKHRKPT